MQNRRELHLKLKQKNAHSQATAYPPSKPLHPREDLVLAAKDILQQDFMQHIIPQSSSNSKSFFCKLFFEIIL